MKKTRFFLALFLVSLLFVLSPDTAKAAIWDVPVGPGESFRWVFVTSAVRDATSPNIDDYNTFVNDVADAAGTLITGVVGKSSIADIDWKAIASTSSWEPPIMGVYALDNIGPTTSGIYNPNGILVANGTTDMFDGSLQAPIMFNEMGNPSSNGVWTGISWQAYDPAGGVHAIGESNVWYGAPMYCLDWAWCSWDTEQPGCEFALYAISEELTVIPAPGALILAATGLLMLGLKRLRRKH